MAQLICIYLTLDYKTEQTYPVYTLETFVLYFLRAGLIVSGVEWSGSSCKQGML